MYRTGINEVSQRHLVNTAKSLVARMSNDIKDQRVIDGDETIYRVIEALDLFVLLRMPVDSLLKRFFKCTTFAMLRRRYI